MDQTLNSNVIDKSKKSSTCFKHFQVKGLAKCLSFAGFIPIPLKSQNGKLVPGYVWKDFTLPEDPFEAVGIVKELFSKSEAAGVALKCGISSGLIVLDVDHPERFESFYPLQKLITQAPYVVRTKDEGHYHIGFAYDPDFSESKNFLAEAGFELKSNGSLVNFFTILPEAQYKPIKLEPLRPMPQELKEKILALMARPKDPSQKETSELQKPKDIDLQKIIELVSEVYQKEHRQDWTIYTAGYLRKLGFSYEETKEALEEFLREQGDEELSMRLAGIKHTFQVPLENVKGLTGLLELGLSERTFLKLNTLHKAPKGESQASRYFTLKEILNLKVKKPSWIIPNLLPEGFSILGGKPKIGKSWLALQIALTCVQMGKRVVYFALEDTPGRLQKRLKVLGIENTEALPDLIVFSFELDRIGKGAIKEIRNCIQELSPELIIIDPWVKLKPQLKGKDLFLEEYRALEVLKDLTKEGVSILVIHHARKTQGEDPVDEILGSTGQTAVVDNILVLKRGRGDKTAVLHLILRDFEGADIGLRFENGWKLEGSAKEVMLAEEQRKIVEAIKSLENIGEKATPKAIAELIGKSQGAVKVALLDLVQKGVVCKKERGVYSLLDTNTKRANLTNLTNLTNFPNFPNFSPNLSNQTDISSFVSTEDQRLGKVSSSDKNELTFLAQDFQGLQEKVSLVSKVSSVSQIDIKPFTSDLSGQTPTSLDTQSDRTNDKTKEPREEVVYLIMPEDRACERCGCKVWKVQKRNYRKRSGYGQCAKCGHISFIGDFNKGKVLDEFLQKASL